MSVNRDNLQNSLAKYSILFISLLAFWLFLFSSRVNASPTILDSNDPLFGVWINEEYDRTGETYSKWIFLPDGTELDYYKLLDLEPAAEVRNNIEKKWIDANGIHWYQIRTKWRAYPNGRWTEGFLLAKIDIEKLSIESVYSENGYPDELTSLGSKYRILYKQHSL